MSARTSTCLSIAALLVAVFGFTGVGEAAWNQVAPRGSVGTLQLKRNAVTSSKLAPNSVRTAHVVNGSLLTDDFKPGQIPQGPKGDKGDRGERGPAGISGYEIVTQSVSVPANTVSGVQPTCPAGKRLLGGAHYTQGVGSATGVFFQAQFAGANSTNYYNVVVTNTNATARMVFAQAICARVAA
jgi:hypothetical protein